MKINRISVGQQDEINKFIWEQETREDGTVVLTLGESIVYQILKDMMDKKCRINASKTDHEKAKMWIEIEWSSDERKA